LRSIELFPCAGGMAEGFRRAGITFDLAFDWSADACDSYERNLGHRPIGMDVRDLLRMLLAGASLGSVDLLVADPPCTPWSRAGKRKGLDDEADMLAETCALIAAVRPTCWLIGNVPGLDDETNQYARDRTFGELARGSGYCVDYQRFDAANYGVPQHRVRPFWFGHPRGSTCIRWPEPTHGPPRQLGLPGLALLPWITCRDALGHLDSKELGRPIRAERRPRGANPASTPDEPAYTIDAKERGARGGACLLLNDKHPINRADEPSFTITTKGDGRGAQGACVLEWPWDRPATTVTADPNGRMGPPNHYDGSRYSHPNAIKLSERAAAILQGFPESWHFAGKTKASRWDQLGMAMPPPMAAAVARSIVAWFAKLNENCDCGHSAEAHGLAAPDIGETEADCERCSCTRFLRHGDEAA
jgi:DNA (cytosine-5)-methyltransferase 1